MKIKIHYTSGSSSTHVASSDSVNALFAQIGYAHYRPDMGGTSNVTWVDENRNIVVVPYIERIVPLELDEE